MGSKADPAAHTRKPASLLSPQEDSALWDAAASGSSIPKAWNEARHEKYAEYQQVHDYAKQALSSTDGGATVATEVPPEMRHLVLQAIQERADEEKPSGSRSYPAKVAKAAAESVIGTVENVGHLAEQGINAATGSQFGYSPDQWDFLQNLRATAKKADPAATGSNWNPANWPIQAAEFTGDVLGAGGVSSLATKGAAKVGLTKTAAKIAGGAAGAATVFVAPHVGQKYDALIAEGVEPSTARWAVGAGAIMDTALFAGIGEALGWKEGVPADVSLTIAKRLAAWGKGAGHGAGMMAATSGKDALLKQIGLAVGGKSPGIAAAAEDVLNQAWEGESQAAGPMALLALPRALASLPDNPSRAAYEKAGGPKGTSAAERAEAVQTARQKLNEPEPPAPPAEGEPNAQQIPQAGPNDGSGGPQPGLRQEGGRPPEGRPGLQPGGRGDRNLEGQAPPQDQAAEANRQPNQPDAAGVAPKPQNAPEMPPEAPGVPSASAEAPRAEIPATEAGSGQTYGIRNAKMAETTGKPEPETTGQLSDKAAWDDAMKASPAEIDATLDKLRKDPSLAASKLENAQILRRVTEVGNQLQKAVRSKKPDEAGQQALEDQLVELQGLSKRTGTAQAQALQSRKMESDQDFSLGHQVQRLRESKEAPLTPQERTKLADVTAENERLTAELAKQREDAKNAGLDKAHDKIVEEVVSSKKRTPEDNIRDYAKRNNVSYDRLLSDASEVHAGMKEEVAARAAAKKYAHEITGISGLDRFNIENNGKDFSSVKGFDVKAGRVVDQHPEVFDETARQDPSRAVWDLIAEKPIKELRLDDPQVLKEAASMSSGGFDLSPEPESKAPKPSSSARRAEAQKRVQVAVAAFKLSFKNLMANPTTQGIPVDLINKGIEVVRAYSAKTFTEFMVKAKEWMGDDAEKMRPVFAEAWKGLKESGELPERDVEVDDPQSVGRLAKQLHREVVELGITDREKAVDAVHEELGQYVDGLTRQQTEDAMSGRGEYRQLNKDEILAKVREHKGELRELGNLRDYESGKAAPKTGFERQDPSDFERQTRQKVNEAKKRGGFDVTDPATQLKSSLDAAKKAIRNRMADKTEEMRTGQRIVKERTPLKVDEELTALREADKALSEKHDEAFPKEPMSDAKRAEITGKALDRSITQLEADLKAGKLEPDPKKPGVSTPAIEAKRAKLNELRTIRDEMRDAANPKLSPEERSDLAYTRSLQKRLADYEDRVAKGDYAKKPIVKRTPNSEQFKTLRKIDKQKEILDAMNRAARRENRSWREATMDRMVKTLRFGLLTFSSTFEHLTGATGWRLVERPIRETVATAYRKLPLTKKLFEGAPTQGGGDYESMLHGYSKFFTKGLLDGWDTVAKGKSELSKYPIHKSMAQVIGDIPQNVRDIINAPNLTAKGKKMLFVAGEKLDAVLDTPGTVHEGIKAPIARLYFEDTFARSMKWEIENGAEPHDLAMIERSKARAIEAAMRAKLSEDNRWVNWVNQFKRIDPKAAADVQLAQMMATSSMPISRIPMNFVGQVMEHLTGLVTTFTGLGEAKSLGGPGLRKAFREGLDSLKPDEKDIICRRLVSGTIGTGTIGGLMLAGFFGAGYFGGLYQPGKKQEEGEKKPGEVGWLSAHLSKNPIWGAIQVGETFIRTRDQIISNGDGELLADASAAWAVILGLSDNLPIVQAAELTSKIEHDRSGNTLFKEVERRVTPGFVQEQAEPAPTRSPLRRGSRR
jgi:hypothetical protein